MGILLTRDTRVLVQGITGYQGRFHTLQMKKYGTKIVAGVTPGHGGEMVEEIPVYNSIVEAKNNHEIDASIIFVPAPSVLSAAFEAIEAGIKLLVIITEHVPVYDTAQILNFARKNNTFVIGPNCPGLITPGEAKLGIIPGKIVKTGTIGLISRSGTLTYEIIQQLTNKNMGQSTAIGIGGDPLHGIGFIEALELFEKDPQTRAIVMIGEIGGEEEELAAEYIAKNISKPVVAFIAGRSAPKGKKMGHAGAIVSGNRGTAESKMKALENANVPIAKLPTEIPELIKKIMQ